MNTRISRVGRHSDANRRTYMTIKLMYGKDERKQNKTVHLYWVRLQDAGVFRLLVLMAIQKGCSIIYLTC